MRQRLARVVAALPSDQSGIEMNQIVIGCYAVPTEIFPEAVLQRSD